ncbi:MAG: carboxypeptidase-like regulatory domain-containing protein [Lacipirellulaceae bacterium]
MKRIKIQFAAAAVACASMLISPIAMAAPAAKQARPSDIALRDGGVLVGQIMTPQGTAVASAPVSIQKNGREIIRVATNAKGEFTVAHLKGGVYQVAAPGHQGSYRLWAPKTAPPAASTGLMAVAGDQAVLGNHGAGPFATVTNWVATHPIMTAGIVAAAVAIPLAVDDDDDNAATGP